MSNYTGYGFAAAYVILFLTSAVNVGYVLSPVMWSKKNLPIHFHVFELIITAMQLTIAVQLQFGTVPELMMAGLIVVWLILIVLKLRE